MRVSSTLLSLVLVSTQHFALGAVMAPRASPTPACEVGCPTVDDDGNIFISADIDLLGNRLCVRAGMPLPCVYSSLNGNLILTPLAFACPPNAPVECTGRKRSNHSHVPVRKVIEGRFEPASAISVLQFKKRAPKSKN